MANELYPYDDDIVQDLLNRMKRAADRGTGMRLSADEIKALSVTVIGQMWEDEDPRDTRTK